MNIQALMQAKQLWSRFKQNHPKFEPFMNAVRSRGIPEGTVVSIEVEYPNEGGSMKTNMRVSEDDMEILDLLKSLMK